MDPGPRKKSANKIFVGGLHWETTDDKLRKHFCMFGEVTDAVVMKDPVSRRSRGFGFITFADAAAVERVLSQDNHILDSRRVEAKRAVPRSETMKDTPPTPPMRPLGLNPPGALPPGLLAGPPSQYLAPPSVPFSAANGSHPATNKIFVGGLHYETKDAEFRQYFENFGRVVSAEVMFNRETHKSRGFGFVVFEDEQAVENVLATPQHSIDGKLVEVKRAIPRSHTNSPSARGLSPSFGGLNASASSKALLGHGTGGMAPTPFALDKALHRPGMSYASVLRRGGRMDGDMMSLAESMGGLSLRAKQEALGLAGPTHWTTIEQILESAEGGYPMSHASLAHQQQLRDQHTAAVLSGQQQYYGAGAESAAQAAYLQQPHTSLAAMEEYSHALHMQQNMPRQAAPKPAQMVDMGYPSSQLSGGLLAEAPGAPPSSSSRFPFASAGGQGGASLLWASPFSGGEPMEGGPTHPPSLPTQPGAAPPQSQGPGPSPPSHPLAHSHHYDGGPQGPPASSASAQQQQQQLSWLYASGGGGRPDDPSLASAMGNPSSSPLSTVPSASMANMGDYGGAGLNGYSSSSSSSSNNNNLYRPSALDAVQSRLPGGDMATRDPALSTAHY